MEGSLEAVDTSTAVEEPIQEIKEEEEEVITNTEVVVNEEEIVEEHQSILEEYHPLSDITEEPTNVEEKSEDQIALEKQLQEVQRQLLALSTLPSTIQATLDSVTKQLAELLPAFKLQKESFQIVKPPSPKPESPVDDKGFCFNKFNMKKYQNITF